MTDQLPAPVPGKDPVDETVVTLQPDGMATHAADDQNAVNNSYNRTVRALREQPLRRIRVTKEVAPVYFNINGYKGWYDTGVHMVPEQIAQLLEDAGRV